MTTTKFPERLKRRFTRKPHTANPTEPVYSRKDMRRGGGFGVLLSMSQLAAAGVIVWLIWQSVAVYVDLGVAIAGNGIKGGIPDWLAWILMNTWVIGWVLAWFIKGGFALVSVAGMLLLYALLQIGEVAPLLLENSPQTLRRLIGSILSQKRLALKATDPKTVQFLKERHNNIPTAWVESIYVAKWICYGVDFFICLLACPPIRGGWARLHLVLAAPTFGDVDWVNVAKIAITLFAVEVGFFVYLWIKRGRVILSTPAEDEPTDAN